MTANICVQGINVLRHLLLVTTLLHCEVAAAQRADNNAAPVPISVSASVLSAHGPSWGANMIPSGTVHARAHYSTPAGSAFGTFFGGEETVKVVRRALEESAFFTLPSDIRPGNAQYDRLDFILEVTVGDKAHRVRLYAPAPLPKQNEQVSRFLKVWNAVFDKIPLRPDLDLELAR